MAKNDSTRKTKELPLVNLINEKTELSLLNYNNNQFSLPICVKNNLKHNFRPYQINAMKNLDWTQKQQYKDSSNNYRQLLFNMATGSGKTDVMAAIILYMYSEYGYQNFLFVVNTNSVLSKTFENLLNDNSSKYLFDSPININSNDILIKQVNVFPENQEDGVIYLKLSTIQSLSNDIDSPRENGLTIDNLKRIKLITLADEAHHFSSNTKTKTKSDEDDRSWEKTLDKIRNCNKDNRQFEFTATIDLDDDNVYNKYKDKIVYRYELSEFIYQGYSKKVSRIQANNNDEAKMLNAVLLSQYRKKLAISLGIKSFKPVVLFKSNFITDSLENYTKFNEMINDLSETSLIQFIENQNKISKSTALSIAYDYWIEKYNENGLVEDINEIQRDFHKRNTINVNVKGPSRNDILGDERYFKSLNTLEDPDNPFRAIFAVAKLSEGWDVLNLYDVVRLGSSKSTKKQTNSEAQLVGRGARYYPFEYDGKKSFKRRFDNNEDIKLSLLETIHYHTISDSAYIKNLKASFDKMDLPVEDDSDFNTYSAEVKKGFMNSKIYKYGNLYYNKVENIPQSSYDSLKRYGVDIDSAFEVDMIEGSVEADYNQKIDNKLYSELIYVFQLKDATKFVQKGMSKNKFFRFNNLSKYIPILESLNSFMIDPQWLGNIKLYARVSKGQEDLNREQKLTAVCKCLSSIQKRISSNFKKQRGTNEFMPVPIKDVIKDYSKRVATSDNNVTSTAVIKPFPISSPWYVYDIAIVDRLEENMINVLSGYIDQLKEKYKQVYLIRNEETFSNGIKLHQFSGDVYHYEGYMPDFVLYLGDSQYSYQIYVEPKGSQLVEQDSWKQNLLESIRPENVDVIGENDKVKLYGLRFYTPGDTLHMFKEMEDMFINNKE